MKINWKSRIKNIVFWISTMSAVITPVLATYNIKPSMATSWSKFIDMLVTIFSNPVLLLTLVMTVLGIVTDTSTKGLSDHAKEGNDDKTNNH